MKQSFKGHKNSEETCYGHNWLISKEMMRSGNAVLSHSSLIPSETVYEKRRGLLWPIARKKNLISQRSVAFFTIFVSNLVHAYKFHGNFKTAQ